MLDIQPQSSGGRPGSYLGSTASIIDNAGKIPDVPPGLTLTAEEQVIWQSLMKAKQFSEWHAPHLNIAYRIVKWETILRRGQAQLDQWIAEGGDPLHPDSILNDYQKNLVSAAKTQITLLRAIGLTSQSVVSAKNSSVVNREQRAFNDVLESGQLPGFLARPNA